jgi:hypothetical protein
MADGVAAEYRTVVEAARESARKDDVSRRRALARLRRALRAIRARDYFPRPDRAEAERAVEELASIVEVSP